MEELLIQVFQKTIQLFEQAIIIVGEWETERRNVWLEEERKGGWSGSWESWLYTSSGIENENNRGEIK